MVIVSKVDFSLENLIHQLRCITITHRKSHKSSVKPFCVYVVDYNNGDCLKCHYDNVCIYYGEVRKPLKNIKLYIKVAIRLVLLLMKCIYII